ncbi:TPA: hypothetical protein MCD18_004144 [Klebsiella quasipneumoniae]|nr:hypothetical protein [Klebsiella quasipneumoniae]HBT6128559.1 hypothetical protein [Klebsiella quasipneumoniae]HBT6221977.1 hypothetical protein [Klebsiella quasipneumoniae]HBT6244265.1 hypothetical protein [Klebsiella quasipneumoniae]
MTERGMIFNAEMVRAILDGRKTQTRRIMAPQPADDIERGIFPDPEAIGWKSSLRHKHGSTTAHFCPYGKPGDRIWVRETFCPVDDTQYGGEKWVDYRATPKFEASHPAGWDSAPNDAEALKWRPSIHMPRWASRILLEITGVRVERLNSIHDVDAMREGIQNLTACSHSDFGIPGVVNAQHPVRAFQLLWESIYGTDSWSTNPWVWVIEFKRVEGGAA